MFLGKTNFLTLLPLPVLGRCVPGVAKRGRRRTREGVLPPGDLRTRKLVSEEIGFIFSLNNSGAMRSRAYQPSMSESQAAAIILSLHAPDLDQDELVPDASSEDGLC